MTLKRKKGFTLVELAIVIAVIAILATVFSSVMVPTMNFFFYYPQSSRVNAAAADLMRIIVEGDEKAEGLRFAGPPCMPPIWVTGTTYAVGDSVFQSNLIYYCLVGHTAGTFATDLASGNWTTSHITSASATSLTYRYSLTDTCGAAPWVTATGYTVGNYVSQSNKIYICLIAHTSGTFATDLASGDWAEVNKVTLTYDSVNHIVTRSINGQTATAIPYYATTSSGIKFDPPAATNFFRYYDSAGTEMTGGGIVLASIYRVDITLNATSGSGNVKHAAGQITMKAGVDIKRYG